MTSKVRSAYALGLFRGTFCLIFQDILNVQSVLKHSIDFMLKFGIITRDSEFVFVSGMNDLDNGSGDQIKVIKASSNTPNFRFLQAIKQGNRRLLKSRVYRIINCNNLEINILTLHRI